MRTHTHILVIAGTTLAANAQPFAHNIGEPLQARESASDITLLTGREIAAVGSISFETANLFVNGYIVVSDPEGNPSQTWITEDPDSERDELLAAREDRVDKNLIVLQEGVLGINPPVNDLVLFKIDPFTGAFAWQWRYPGTHLGQNLGMELDGDTGLVAASEAATFGGTQPTLLRFRNNTGLPVFHYRYVPANAPAFNGRFFDVAVDPDSGDIFAVGSIQLDAPGFTPEPKLLIARFNAAGAPIWFNAYEIRVENNDDAGTIEGTSIELVGARVAVTARVADPVFGPLAAHVVVDQAAGAPVVSAAVANTAGMIDPAFSSLELRSNDTMLVSGTMSNAAGANVPAVWTFDVPTAGVVWAWTPDAQDGIGNSAIPQDNRGPLLAGNIIPNAGPIGGLRDLFLARTTNAGFGLCPTTPDLRHLNTQLQVAQIPVERIEMPNPNQAGLEAIPGDPARRFVCDPCPADLAAPFGVLNFFDIAEFIARYNAMDPSADLAPPFGVWNFFDIAEYINLYNAGCP